MKPMPVPLRRLRHVLALTAAAAGAALIPAAALALDDPADGVAQGSDQSATAAATQVLPINANVLPINANVPVCLSLGSCSNTSNGADQVNSQENSASASASNSSRQHVYHHRWHH